MNPLFCLLVFSALLGFSWASLARADEAPPPATAPVAAQDSSSAVHEASVFDMVRRFSLNKPTARVQLRGYVELGLLAVVDHQIQLSSDGAKFDYVHEGGQNTLSFFARVR